MTYTRNKMATLTGNAQTAYRQWHAGEAQRSTLDRVELALYEYVEGLLAEKNAEIKRLEARQSAILAAFDAHCVAWEIEGPHDLYLGGDLHEGVNETFAALYHVIKEKGE